MSIWSSMPGLDDDTPGGPAYRYYGSAVMPGRPGQSRGNISLAQIPSHITHDGRDDGPEDDAPQPWLRLAFDWIGPDSVAVLTVEQARHLAAQLTDWADRAQHTHDSGHTRASDATDTQRAPGDPKTPTSPQTPAQDREQWSAIIAAEVDAHEAADRLITHLTRQQNHP